MESQNSKFFTAHFTGHRPQAKCMYGFNMRDERYQLLYKKLTEVIKLCICDYDIRNFISGGALGVDQMAFWCVHKIKNIYSVKNILALPFEKQDSVWTMEQKYWYRKMLEKADEIIFVDTSERYQIKDTIIGEYHKAKLQKRNEFMVDNSRITIAVWDGSKGGTMNCVRYAEKNSGRLIIKIDPKNNWNIGRLNYVSS